MAPTAEPNRWEVLALLGTAQLMVVLDATIVNIALPSAQADLGFDAENRQWIITAYALAFGSLLLVGGKLGDLFGRKWTFIAGLIGFSVASALGGLAQSFGVLVGARALQGVFGALLAPSALSLLTVTFAGAPDRPKAFGIFGAIAGGGASVGLLLGGILTEALSWRWCLYVNLVIALPAALVAFRLLAQPGRPRAAEDRLAGRGGGVVRPVRAGVRVLQRRVRVVERPADPGLLRRQRRPADVVRVHRAPHRPSAAAAAHRLGPRPRRRLRVDRPGRLGRVRGVPVPDLLHAADAGLLGAQDRRRVPADDRRDRGHLHDRADQAPGPRGRPEADQRAA